MTFNFNKNCRVLFLISIMNSCISNLNPKCKYYTNRLKKEKSKYRKISIETLEKTTNGTRRIPCEISWLQVKRSIPIILVIIGSYD